MRYSFDIKLRDRKTNPKTICSLRLCTMQIFTHNQQRNIKNLEIQWEN
ncbi:hypothetical protein [Brunnivagina elsteri]|nr:hypothetical protein [Calothrix elsteri]